MPHRHCALKQLRKDKKRRLHNLKIKQDLKKAIKKFQAFLKSSEIDKAKSLLPEINSKLDKAAKKRVIHPNKASRLISRLSHKLGKSTQLSNK